MEEEEAVDLEWDPLLEYTLYDDLHLVLTLPSDPEWDDYQPGWIEETESDIPSVSNLSETLDPKSDHSLTPTTSTVAQLETTASVPPKKVSSFQSCNSFWSASSFGSSISSGQLGSAHSALDGLSPETQVILRKVLDLQFKFTGAGKRKRKTKLVNIGPDKKPEKTAKVKEIKITQQEPEKDVRCRLWINEHSIVDESKPVVIKGNPCDITAPSVHRNESSLQSCVDTSDGAISSRDSESDTRAKAVDRNRSSFLTCIGSVHRNESSLLSCIDSEGTTSKGSETDTRVKAADRNVSSLLSFVESTTDTISSSSDSYRTAATHLTSSQVDSISDGSLSFETASSHFSTSSGTSYSDTHLSDSLHLTGSAVFSEEATCDIPCHESVVTDDILGVTSGRLTYPGYAVNRYYHLSALPEPTSEYNRSREDLPDTAGLNHDGDAVSPRYQVISDVPHPSVATQQPIAGCSNDAETVFPRDYSSAGSGHEGIFISPRHYTVECLPYLAPGERQASWNLDERIDKGTLRLVQSLTEVTCSEPLKAFTPLIRPLYRTASDDPKTRKLHVLYRPRDATDPSSWDAIRTKKDPSDRCWNIRNVQSNEVCRPESLTDIRVLNNEEESTEEYVPDLLKSDQSEGRTSAESVGGKTQNHEDYAIDIGQTVIEQANKGSATCIHSSGVIDTIEMITKGELKVTEQHDSSKQRHAGFQGTESHANSQFQHPGPSKETIVPVKTVVVGEMPSKHMKKTEADGEVKKRFNDTTVQSILEVTPRPPQLPNNTVASKAKQDDENTSKGIKIAVSDELETQGKRTRTRGVFRNPEILRNEATEKYVKEDSAGNTDLSNRSVKERIDIFETPITSVGSIAKEMESDYEPDDTAEKKTDFIHLNNHQSNDVVFDTQIKEDSASDNLTSTFMDRINRPRDETKTMMQNRSLSIQPKRATTVKFVVNEEDQQVIENSIERKAVSECEDSHVKVQAIATDHNPDITLATACQRNNEEIVEYQSNEDGHTETKEISARNLDRFPENRTPLEDNKYHTSVNAEGLTANKVKSQARSIVMGAVFDVLRKTGTDHARSENMTATDHTDKEKARYIVETVLTNTIPMQLKKVQGPGIQPDSKDVQRIPIDDNRKNPMIISKENLPRLNTTHDKANRETKSDKTRIYKSKRQSGDGAKFHEKDSHKTTINHGNPVKEIHPCPSLTDILSNFDDDGIEVQEDINDEGQNKRDSLVETERAKREYYLSRLKTGQTEAVFGDTDANKTPIDHANSIIHPCPSLTDILSNFDDDGLEVPEAVHNSLVETERAKREYYVSELETGHTKAVCGNTDANKTTIDHANSIIHPCPSLTDILSNFDDDGLEVPEVVHNSLVETKRAKREYYVSELETGHTKTVCGDTDAKKTTIDHANSIIHPCPSLTDILSKFDQDGVQVQEDIDDEGKTKRDSIVETERAKREYYVSTIKMSLNTTKQLITEDSVEDSPTAGWIDVPDKTPILLTSHNSRVPDAVQANIKDHQTHGEWMPKSASTPVRQAMGAYKTPVTEPSAGKRDIVNGTEENINIINYGGINPNNMDTSIRPRRPDVSTSPRKPDASTSPRRPDGSISPKRPGVDISPRRPDGSISPRRPDVNISPRRPDVNISPRRRGVLGRVSESKNCCAHSDPDSPSRVKQLTAMFEGCADCGGACEACEEIQGSLKRSPRLQRDHSADYFSDDYDREGLHRDLSGNSSPNQSPRERLYELLCEEPGVDREEKTDRREMSVSFEEKAVSGKEDLKEDGIDESGYESFMSPSPTTPGHSPLFIPPLDLSFTHDDEDDQTGKNTGRCACVSTDPAINAGSNQSLVAGTHGLDKDKEKSGRASTEWWSADNSSVNVCCVYCKNRRLKSAVKTEM